MFPSSNYLRIFILFSIVSSCWGKMVFEYYGRITCSETERCKDTENNCKVMILTKDTAIPVLVEKCDIINVWKDGRYHVRCTLPNANTATLRFSGKCRAGKREYDLNVPQDHEELVYTGDVELTALS